MKNSTIRFSALLIATLGFGTFIGCGSAHFIGNSEIPTAKTIGPVMWSQAQLADPAFKKINAPVYHDADWAAFNALGDRLQIASAKLKQDFSQGENWNALAIALGVHGKELIEASQAKDHKAASTALTMTRATCRACHNEFR